MTDLVLVFEQSLARRTGKKPFPYQRVDARWLSKRRRGCIFHCPGAGKSWIWLLALPRNAPVLLVCPGVAKRKWASEVRAVRPDLRPFILDGRRAFRWPRPGEVVITNWESLPHSYAEQRRLSLRVLTKARGEAHAKDTRALRLVNRSRARLTLPYPGTVVIPDEAHRANNVDAKTTTRIRELAAMALRAHGACWPGTGTPLINPKRKKTGGVKLKELYAVLQMNGSGEREFGTLAAFEELAEKDQAEFHRKMRNVSVVRTRADILPDLPPIRRDVLPVAIDDATQLRCDQFVHELKRRGIRLENLSIDLLARLGAPNSPTKMAVSVVRAALASAKTPAVMHYLDTLEQQGEGPLVVVSAHRPPIDVISARRGFTRISGAESNDEKGKRAEAFQRGEFRGVALTYQAAGEAIDLYRAWRAVQVDLPWTVKALEQFEARLQRIGQVAAGLLFTTAVAEHPLDRRVAEIIAEKRVEIERHVAASARKARDKPVDTEPPAE